MESGVTANGQIQLSERSVTPFMPDLMDPSVCYIPNVYPSPAYYYGSKMMCLRCQINFFNFIKQILENSWMYMDGTVSESWNLNICSTNSMICFVGIK